MSAPIDLRGEVSADELRGLAVRAKDAAQARRLLALAAVCAGETRARAAKIGGMDRQTLRDWVHRFNAGGVAGLINIKPSGRPSRLSDAHKEDLRQLVEAGSDAERDGVARWRCADLKRVLSARHGVDLSEVSIGRVLKQLGFSHISARPRHPAQDPQAIEHYKKKSSRPWSSAFCRNSRPERRSRCGFRMRCGSDRRTAWSINGPRPGRGRASRKTSAMPTPMSSVRSAPSAGAERR